MRLKILPWIAWFVTVIIIISSLFDAGRELLAYDSTMGLAQLASQLGWILSAIVFAIPAALIVSRQPRNLIGWLLMLPAFTLGLFLPVTPLYTANQPPASISFSIWFSLWFESWSWMIFIFPILLIPLLFPDGRLLSPRWRWVIVYIAGMMLVLIFLATFARKMSPQEFPAGWSLDNPIGFIENNIFESQYFYIPWMVSLIGVTIICISALFVRFRHAGRVERAQMKWLLTACAFFGVVYTIVGLYQASGPLFYWIDLLFIFSILTLPLAIAIAILRHRLFDIDIIIRKTLVYALLSSLLGITFFGSVVILQSIFNLLFSTQSQAAIVISTLAMAAIFTPLRRRVQTFIDRRFFRQKYDSGKLLEGFARRTRDETDLDSLSKNLMEVVQETMQPNSTGLWINSRKTK